MKTLIILLVLSNNLYSQEFDEEVFSINNLFLNNILQPFKNYVRVKKRAYSISPKEDGLVLAKDDLRYLYKYQCLSTEEEFSEVMQIQGISNQRLRFLHTRRGGSHACNPILDFFEFDLPEPEDYEFYSLIIPEWGFGFIMRTNNDDQKELFIMRSGGIQIFVAQENNRRLMYYNCKNCTGKRLMANLVNNPESVIKQYLFDHINFTKRNFIQMQIDGYTQWIDRDIEQRLEEYQRNGTLPNTLN